jgi:hypothetical protein
MAVRSTAPPAQRAVGTRSRAYGEALFQPRKVDLRVSASSWRFPSLFALALGCAVQVALGIFASLLSLVLLIAARPQRCPVAVGGASHRPFYAWLVGVVAGVAIADSQTELTHTPLGSWVVWGAISVEIWRWQQGL